MHIYIMGRSYDMLIGFIIAIVLVIIYHYVMPSKHQKMPPVLYYFYSTDCKYCTEMDLTWNTVRMDYAIKPVRFEKVNIYNVDVWTKNMLANFGVETVPRLALVFADGRRYFYDDPKSAAPVNDLKSFLEEHLD